MSAIVGFGRLLDLELRPGETPIWIKYDDEHNHMIDDCRIRVSLERLVDLFNRWARAWRDHPPCDALIIKHSSLVFDLSYNVERIAKFLGAPMPSEITSPGLVPMSRQFTGVIRDQYNNPDYFEFLDDSTAQKARSLVDPGVTAWLSFTQ